MSGINETIIEVRDLCKYFDVGRKSKLHAVDGVNLKIRKGQTLGVVGESGCGKSTLGRTLLRLIEPTSGEIIYKGEDITKLGKQKMRALRSEMQIIFQDPYSSINPHMTVEDIIMRPMVVNNTYPTRKEMREKARELMDTVGLAARLHDAYPHELDGGRRQRIGVARALALNPSFIVCDEPVSALDVSIQAQIINLLMDLQDELGLSYMFITHDLSVVKHISHEIAVMYLGQCIERAPTAEIFKNPQHPYTRMLLAAIPRPNLSARRKKLEVIRGEVTNPIDPPPGCRFAARCPYAVPACSEKDPVLTEIAPEHFVSCHLIKDGSLQTQ